MLSVVSAMDVRDALVQIYVELTFSNANDWLAPNPYRPYAHKRLGGTNLRGTAW